MPKSDRFVIPGSLSIERTLRKDGPSPVYVAWIPHTSRLFYEQKALLKFCKWPASTESGQRLRDWLKQFDDTNTKAPAHNQDAIKNEGFGPEAFAEEPNDNTKMIT